MKICLRCHRLSVEFDYVRGEERCLWRDCNWVNDKKVQLTDNYGEAKVWWGITAPYLKNLEKKRNNGVRS